MSTGWTSSQMQRLKELSAGPDLLSSLYPDPAGRDRAFQEVEKALVDRAKNALLEVQRSVLRPKVSRLESRLCEILTAMGFVQVSTPIILARGLLEKMTITADHPLFDQVFWVSDKKCLRPMLAPNLYYLLKDLLRLWDKPVSIFEVGPCFRKESQGARHLNEFTMLNLVEMGLPEEGRRERIAELAAAVMEGAGISDYQLVVTQSEVYGETIDVEAGIEVGSAAMGPHRLDPKWGIFVPWVGIGFGLERLVMVKEGDYNIQKAGRSLTYINGIRLNL